MESRSKQPDSRAAAISRLLENVRQARASGLIGAGQQRQGRDPQSSFEPRSGPGEGQKYLQRFVGTWDVTKTFYPRSGQPSVAKGDCVQTMINDGRFLKSDFTFHAENGDTTGMGLIGFEPDSGKFT